MGFVDQSMGFIEQSTSMGFVEQGMGFDRLQHGIRRLEYENLAYNKSRYSIWIMVGCHLIIFYWFEIYVCCTVVLLFMSERSLVPEIRMVQITACGTRVWRHNVQGPY